MKDDMNEKDLELLSAALDGECGDPAALRARLNAEPELALRMRQLQAVRARLASLPVPAPPADFAAQVTERAFARKLVLPGRRFWWFAVPAAVAATVVVMTALNRPAPGPEVAAFDNGMWQTALDAAAASPDAEMLAAWVDEEPALDEALAGDLTGTLAELSAREPDVSEDSETNGLDAGGSVVDIIDQLTDEDAAVLAARMRPGA